MRKIHLWLGLASSPVIVVLGVTGLPCFLFQPEIENATQHYRFVTAQEKYFLPPS